MPVRVSVNNFRYRNETLLHNLRINPFVIRFISIQKTSIVSKIQILQTRKALVHSISNSNQGSR